MPEELFLKGLLSKARNSACPDIPKTSRGVQVLIDKHHSTGILFSPKAEVDGTSPMGLGTLKRRSYATV